MVSFSEGGGKRIGALSGESVVDLTAARVAGSMLELIASGEAGLTRARDAAKAANAIRLALAAVRLLQPVPRPGKVLCCGINYRRHAADAGQSRPRSSYSQGFLLA